MANDRVLWFAAWVSNSGRVAWRWGPPRDSAREAAADLKAELASGTATWGTLVRFEGGRKIPLAGSVRPWSVRRVVRHWEDLLDATET